MEGKHLCVCVRGSEVSSEEFNAAGLFLVLHMGLTSRAREWKQIDKKWDLPYDICWWSLGKRERIRNNGWIKDFYQIPRCAAGWPLELVVCENFYSPGGEYRTSDAEIVRSLKGEKIEPSWIESTSSGANCHAYFISRSGARTVKLLRNGNVTASWYRVGERDESSVTLNTRYVTGHIDIAPTTGKGMGRDESKATASYPNLPWRLRPFREMIESAASRSKVGSCPCIGWGSQFSAPEPPAWHLSTAL